MLFLLQLFLLRSMHDAAACVKLHPSNQWSSGSGALQVVYLGKVPTLLQARSGLRGQLTEFYESCLGRLYFNANRDAFDALLPPLPQ